MLLGIVVLGTRLLGIELLGTEALGVELLGIGLFGTGLLLTGFETLGLVAVVLGIVLLNGALGLVTTSELEVDCLSMPIVLSVLLVSIVGLGCELGATSIFSSLNLALELLS